MRVNLKVVLLLSIFALAHVTESHAQRSPLLSKQSRYETDKSKPSVYLTFEKTGGKKLSSPDLHSNEEQFTLRFHNNFTAPLFVNANFRVSELQVVKSKMASGHIFSFLPNDATVEVCYEVQARPQATIDDFVRTKLPMQIPSSYSCNWTQQRRGTRLLGVLPGESFMFSLPKSFLGENMMVFTTFNYEWEVDENENGLPDTPVHKVYFYASDLPFKLKLGFSQPLN